MTAFYHLLCSVLVEVCSSPQLPWRPTTVHSLLQPRGHSGGQGQPPSPEACLWTEGGAGGVPQTPWGEETELSPAPQGAADSRWSWFLLRSIVSCRRRLPEELLLQAKVDGITPPSPVPAAWWKVDRRLAHVHRSARLLQMFSQISGEGPSRHFSLVEAETLSLFQ